MNSILLFNFLISIGDCLTLPHDFQSSNRWLKNENSLGLAVYRKELKIATEYFNNYKESLKKREGWPFNVPIGSTVQPDGPPDICRLPVPLFFSQSDF
jgi:hypothetical protein